MSLDDRLALVCLRAVVQDLETAGGAGEVLVRVLGSGVAPVPVTDRDPKPAKKTKSAGARRRVAKPARPAAAVEHEAAGLVRALEERHGDLAAAAAALGVATSALGTWRSGRCSPGALTRLREAAHAPVGRGLRFGDKQKRLAQEATPAAAPDEAAAGEGDESAGAA